MVRDAVKRGGLLAVVVALFVAASVTPAPSQERGKGQPFLRLQRAGGRTLGFPSDIAVDRRGVLFLLDSGARSLVLFSPHGEFLREIPSRGAWKDPTALAVAGDGSIFLADGDAGRVLEIDMSGRVRKEFQAGKNARLTGVGVYGDSVYCVDNRNARLVVFKRKGGAPENWGRKGDRPGEFDAPFRLAIDAGGRVFVTDVMNARIQWFSAFGQHMGTLKHFGAGEGKIFRPAGLSIDSRGRVWVGDSYTGLVQLFDENGTFVQSLQAGGRPFVFGDPLGVAAGPEGIWVADQREGQLVLIRR